MKWHGFRIPVVVLALILGLAAFFGAQQLYNKYNYHQPVARALESNSSVESFEVDESQPVLQVKVRLKNVGNIMETYNKLEQDLKNILKRRQFDLKIIDTRDEELKRAFYYSQFAIYEAVLRGNYRDMADYIEKQAAVAKAEAAIFMDDKRIYLQMKRDGHYLYEIVSRLNLTNGEQQSLRENK